MEAVVGSPPEHALLNAKRPSDREDELDRSAGLVRTVGEVPMESGRQKKHSRVVERDRER
jgi:hypothetical protein